MRFFDCCKKRGNDPRNGRRFFFQSKDGLIDLIICETIKIERNERMLEPQKKTLMLLLEQALESLSSEGTVNDEGIQSLVNVFGENIREEINVMNLKYTNTPIAYEVF